MMAKLGYKPGDTLGKEGGRAEPLELSLKEGRGGVGLDTERKRKFRQEVAAEAEEVEKKKLKEGEEREGYRERVGREREEKRVEGMWFGAMKVAEGLDENDELEDGGGRVYQGPTAEEKTKKRKGRRRANVLWRPLSIERQEKELEKRAQKNMMTRLPKLSDLEGDEDADDRVAYGDDVEEDLEDPELDEYLAMPAKERLEKLVGFLREKWHYCFWCKFSYPDESMEGCPGETEDDHD